MKIDTQHHTAEIHSWLQEVLVASWRIDALPEDPQVKMRREFLRSLIWGPHEQILLDAIGEITDKNQELDRTDILRMLYRDKTKIQNQKYWYDLEKYKSDTEYLRFLSKEFFDPTDINKINDFLRYFYEYDQSHERGNYQKMENTYWHYDDQWQKPIEFLTNQSEKTWRIKGDCEDVAFMFQALLDQAGKKNFVFTIPWHAILSWIENDTVYTIDTTWDKKQETLMKNEALARSEKRRQWESDQKLFERIVNSFSKSSDSKSSVHSDRDINMIFQLQDWRSFTIPSNFSTISTHYDTIRNSLEQKDYISVQKIIKEALDKDPGNIWLYIANLQFLLLTNQATQLRGEISGFSHRLPGWSSVSQNQFNAINQFSMFLEQNGKIDLGISLMSSVAGYFKKNPQSIDTNLIDTLSGLYISKWDIQNAYKMDEWILDIHEELLALRESLIDNPKKQYKVILKLLYSDHHLSQVYERYIKHYKNNTAVVMNSHFVQKMEKKQSNL